MVGKLSLILLVGLLILWKMLAIDGRFIISLGCFRIGLAVKLVDKYQIQSVNKGH
jgi:hypothetical protein